MLVFINRDCFLTQFFTNECRAIALLFCIYVFYTVPLAFAQGLVSPQNLDAIFPGLLNQYKSQISGLLGAGVYSLFFSSCPIMFKVRSSVASPFFAYFVYFCPISIMNKPFQTYAFGRLSATLEVGRFLLHKVSAAMILSSEAFT